MTRTQLIAQIKAKRSFLCVGLDTDISKIPSHLLKQKIRFLNLTKRLLMRQKIFVLPTNQTSHFMNAWDQKAGRV